MTPQFVRTFAIIATLWIVSGCAQSVKLIQPAKNPQGQQVAVQNQQGDITLEVEFHSRADQRTFAASLDNRPITSAFPTSGNPRTSTVNVAQGAHVLRLEADMSPTKAFDVLGEDYHIVVVQAPSRPPPPPLSPLIDLSLSNANFAVVWGNAVSLTVTVEGKNGFAGAVDLTLENVPFGVTPSFAPAMVNVPQNGTATSTLNLSTVAAGTKLFPPTLRVRATPQTGGVGYKTANFTLAVLRTPGSFDPVTLRTNNSSCGSVTAAVVATGSGYGVQFTGPPFNRTNPQVISFSSGYALSPRCRIGLVIPPVVQDTHRTTLWNLGFDPAIGAVPLGGRIDNPSGAFTNGYFSQDDSLFLLVIPTGGVGTPQVASAGLYDLALRTKIGESKFFTATIISVVLNGNTVTLNTNPPLSSPNWTVP